MKLAIKKTKMFGFTILELLLFDIMSNIEALLQRLPSLHKQIE